MPHLIIGHVTHTTARVWVRGDSKSKTCEITLTRPGRQHRGGPQQLTADRDFTGIADFDNLEPGTTYTVQAAFEPSQIHARGRLRTMKGEAGRRPLAFSFVLSSCNLSVVSINNFLALLAASAGIQLGMSSLDLPVWRWRSPPFPWLRRLLRTPLKGILGLVGWTIRRFTGVKQPGPPFLRSPFLKLCAIFDSTVLEVIPDPPPTVEAGEAGALRAFLAVGDHVQSSWGATGIVVSTDSFDDQEFIEAMRERNLMRRAELLAAALRPRRLVLTQVEGRFECGDVLSRNIASDSEHAARALGQITVVEQGRKWFEPPAFFIHAGDQIYYDFPTPDRAPDRDEYRMAYQEAWFEDDAFRHLLAHWPHYMTLDDHEIADQFARDFVPPAANYTAAEYLTEANVAYGEYVHALSPPGPNNPPTPKCGPYWYAFNRGDVHFFVLDTRTQRRDDTRTDREKAQGRCQNGTMIDEAQMTAFLDWLEAHRDELKFVVTSVPFVAEINEAVSEEKQDWFKDNSGKPARPVAQEPDEPRRNSEQDKWSARRFQRQRDRIIEFIAGHRIEQLVFLTGDMHCCYHATMRIGKGPKKYESITVHELAAGPVNQLQLAKAEEFMRRSTRQTAHCCPGPKTDYEVVLERFHSSASAVMHIKVEHVEREQITGDGRRRFSPEVEWNVIRTLTDPGPAAWRPPQPVTADELNEVSTGLTGDETVFKEAQRLSEPSPEPVMAGRICFVRQRSPENLPLWIPDEMVPPVGALS